MKLSDLAPFQKDAVHFLVQNKRCILADDRGLGKTLDAMYASFEFPERINSERMLVAVSQNAMGTWRKECRKWYPEHYGRMVFVKHNNKAKRLKMWEDAKTKPGIYVAIYETIRADIEHVPKFWTHIAADEAHKLKNRKSALHKAFKRLRSATLFLLTGTPMSKGPQCLWGLLNLCDSKKWSSYWRFVDTYCIVDFGPFGRDIIGTQNMDKFTQETKNFFMSRKKKDVAPWLPPKIRNFRHVELDTSTRKLYDSLVENLMAALDDEENTLLISKGVLANVIKLRKLLVCPRLLSETLSCGEGIKYVVEDMWEQEINCATVFSMFPSAFPYWKEYLESKGIPTHIIRGGMDMDEVDAAVDAFREQGGVTLASIKFAQSYSMEFCTQGYCIGYEWSPDLNEQAEDRLYRMTTTESVNIDYLVFPDTYDERVLDINNEKSLMMIPVLKAAKDYRAVFSRRPINSC